MVAILEWLEQSLISVYIRQSLWIYPFLEIIHILGIAVLVGAAFLFDLRLLGFSKYLDLHQLANHLLPWSARGLLLIVPSGVLLFATNAKSLGFDQVFWLKMILLLIAGINVLVFHKVLLERQKDRIMENQISLKTSAILSIFLWISIIACGRLLAY